MIDSGVVKNMFNDERLFASLCNTLTDYELIDIICYPFKWRWIQYIDSPSESVCMATVSRNGNAIQYISNPSESVCMAAVHQNGMAIYYISEPSEELLRAAKDSMIEKDQYDSYINRRYKYYELLEAL